MGKGSGSQSVGPNQQQHPPGDVLGMQVLGPHHRLAESQALGWGPMLCAFAGPLRDADTP